MIHLFILCKGWEEKKDAKNRSFYVDHNTKTTTWIRPVPVATSSNNDPGVKSVNLSKQETRTTTTGVVNNNSSATSHLPVIAVTSSIQPESPGNDKKQLSARDLVNQRVIEPKSSGSGSGSPSPGATGVPANSKSPSSANLVSSPANNNFNNNKIIQSLCLKIVPSRLPEKERP